MTRPRVPPHLGVLVGVAAGTYAITLAGVTALQSTADARLIAQRLPARQAAELAARRHERLERSLAAASDRYTTLADRYAISGGALQDLDAALEELATRAASLSESASTLHVSRFTLPQVSRSAPRAAAPATHATTRASGG